MIMIESCEHFLETHLVYIMKLSLSRLIFIFNIRIFGDGFVQNGFRPLFILFHLFHMGIELIMEKYKEWAESVLNEPIPEDPDVKDED